MCKKATNYRMQAEIAMSEVANYEDRLQRYKQDYRLLIKNRVCMGMFLALLFMVTVILTACK